MMKQKTRFIASHRMQLICKRNVGPDDYIEDNCNRFTQKYRQIFEENIMRARLGCMYKKVSKFPANTVAAIYYKITSIAIDGQYGNSRGTVGTICTLILVYVSASARP